MLACAGLTLIAIAILLEGCASAPPREPVTDEQRAAYAEAMAHLEKDRQVGIDALEEFVRVWPRSPLAEEAAYTLAGLANQAGDTEAALRWYRVVVDDHPGGKYADSARVRGARLEYERGAHNQVPRLLKGVRRDRLSAVDQVTLYRLKTSIARDPVEKLRWLAEIREVEGLDRTTDLSVDGEMSGIMARLPREELERAAKQVGKRRAGARVQLALAERALARNDADRAETALSRAREFDLDEADRQLLAQLSARFALMELIAERADLPTFAEAMRLGWKKPKSATGTLGVVLPLSGPFAEYGQASLRGILLAAGLFPDGEDSLAEAQREYAAREEKEKGASGERKVWGADDSASGGDSGSEWGDDPSRPRIVVRDSAGDPLRAAAAVRELAAREDVVAILGPLLSSECEAAALASENSGVPILTLTSRQEIPLERQNVFRMRTTPDDEVRYLVDHAVTELGAQRFAILYPKDAYGLGMRERFWEAVEQRGGHVVGASGYEPGAVDFAQPIRDMIGYVLLTPEERQALTHRSELLRRGRRLPPEVAAVARQVAYAINGPAGDPLPPRVDFDALFIPDSHDKIVLIAPQLAFHELDSVQLLGPSGWNHPDLLRIARHHVGGAIISSSFFEASPFPFVRDFVDAYRSTFGSEPDSYAAHAFDSAELVYGQLAAGMRSREQVRDGVLRINGYPGASGVFTILPDGNARKRPFLVRIRAGRFIPLDAVN